MTGKRITNFTLIAIIGLVLVGLGLITFGLIQKNAPRQGSNSDIDFPQTLRGTITHIETGKDGIQASLQSEVKLLQRYDQQAADRNRWRF